MNRVAYHLFDVCAYAIRTMPECVSVYQWGNTLTVLTNNGFTNQSLTRSPTPPRSPSCADLNVGLQ
jgi:hypothetical protein